MHVADIVKRMMLVRAEVTRQLIADPNSPIRESGDKMRLRENEALIAQYTHAACLLDAADTVVMNQPQQE